MKKATDARNTKRLLSKQMFPSPFAKIQSEFALATAKKSVGSKSAFISNN